MRAASAALFTYRYQMKNLELYYYASCPFCQMVLNKIDDLGVIVEYRDILSDTSALEKLVSDTGRRTVPCLYIDGTPMFESSDIMNWLESNLDQLKVKS